MNRHKSYRLKCLLSNSMWMDFSPYHRTYIRLMSQYSMARQVRQGQSKSKSNRQWDMDDLLEGCLHMHCIYNKCTGRLFFLFCAFWIFFLCSARFETIVWHNGGNTIGRKGNIFMCFYGRLGRLIVPFIFIDDDLSIFFFCRFFSSWWGVVSKHVSCGNEQPWSVYRLNVKFFFFSVTLIWIPNPNCVYT